MTEKKIEVSPEEPKPTHVETIGAKKVNLAKPIKPIEMQRQNDRKLVVGRFKFHECPGGEITFYYRKYKGDPLEKYTFVDDQVYQIPLGVAKHLKNKCWYPTYDHVVDEHNKLRRELNQAYRVIRKNKRMDFQSLEFVDDPELAASDVQIYQAERVPIARPR